MKVGILKPFRGTYRPMLDVYEKILKHNNIEYVYLYINDPEFWEEVRTLDLFLAKISQEDDDLNLANQIWPVISQVLKINCYPNLATLWHYHDKVKQYYLLKNNGFPVADCNIFWDREKAMQWATQTKYPVVFKLKGGAGSSNVTLVRSKKTAIALIKRAFGKGIHPYYYDLGGKLKAYNYNFKKYAKYLMLPYYNKLIRKTNAKSNYIRQKNYVYFQKYMPDNNYDTRVAVLGRRAWAFKRFNRPNDFRASGSNHYDTRRNQIDMNMVKLAFEISFKLGFQSMAYDFVYDEKKQPVILEISYTYGDYPEFSTGYWDPDLNWHDGSYVPEYLELVDSLNIPDLVQPDIKLDSPYLNAVMI